MPTATLLPAAEVPPRIRTLPTTLTRWEPESRLVSWVATLAVTLLAAVTRFWALGFPHGKSFDEVYYATEAQELLRYGYEDNRDYMFIVHPPLGKWAIALTSWLFGDHGPLWHTSESFSWRVAPALAGTISVLIMVRVAQRMFRSVLLGSMAGFFLALDGISVVMSRVALLDIFLQTFILAGFAALVLDRDQMRERLATLYLAGVDLRSGVPSLGPRPWRLTGGVLLGLACAVKWTGAWFWVGFALLSLLWDRGALKAAGVDMPWIAAIKRSWPGAFFSLGVSAIAAYLLTWIGWFVGENSWNRHWSDTHPGSGLFGWLPGGIRSLLNYHHEAYEFHTHLTDPHAYKANPWSWLILGRPISFYAPPDVTGCGATECTREILLIGTPIMYWAMIAAMLWCVWQWVTTRDWRAGSVLLAFIVGWATFLPWPERTGFLYMTPLMPFLALALTLAIGALLAPAAEDLRSRLNRRQAQPARHAVVVPDPDSEEEWDEGLVVRRVGLTEWVLSRGIPTTRLLRTALVAIFLGAVVADFIWMWPIYTGGMLTRAQWLQRMWFPSWI